MEYTSYFFRCSTGESLQRDIIIDYTIVILTHYNAKIQ